MVEGTALSHMFDLLRDKACAKLCFIKPAVWSFRGKKLLMVSAFDDAIGIDYDNARRISDGC